MRDPISIAADLSPPRGSMSRLLTKRKQRSKNLASWLALVAKLPNFPQVATVSLVMIALVFGLVFRWPDGRPHSADGSDWPLRALAMQRTAEDVVRAQRLELSAPNAPVRIYLVAARRADLD